MALMTMGSSYGHATIRQFGLSKLEESLFHYSGVNHKNFTGWKLARGVSFGGVRAGAVNSEIDHHDPDWKSKFQDEFEERFNLPHLNDILAVRPRPTTFSLKKR